MALLRSVATVGGYTMISRVLGFVRDLLLANVLGAGVVADAFFIAFRIPNFFRRLFGEGAFNAAFVPLFARELEQSGHESARTFAEQALAMLLTFLMVLTILAEIAMPWLMYGLAPGFADEPVKFALAVQFTRITFPYLLCMALAALLAGVLNALHRFAAAAAAPILLNIVLIVALLGFAHLTETPGHALAWGVALAGIGQFVWLVAASRRAGMNLRLPRLRVTPQIRRLFRLVIPGAVGAGVVQINLLVGTVIASLLPTGSISYLYYADRVYQLPLGVIGVAVGTALLPQLARQLRAGEDAAAMDGQNRALEISLLLTLPSALALMVVPGPVVSVLFQRGAFGPEAAAATADALAAFALGLPAYVLIRVLSPGFFAREDTTTPVLMATAGVAANIGLSLILIWPLGHVGIALATAAAAWLNAGLLLWGLRRRGALVLDRRLRQRLPRMLGASMGMAALLALAAFGLAEPLAAGQAVRVAALLMLVVGGLAAYLTLAHLVGAADLGEFRALLRRRVPADRA